jgi:hypothetical protein
MREADVGRQSADTIKLNFRFWSSGKDCQTGGDGLIRTMRGDVGPRNGPSAGAAEAALTRTPDGGGLVPRRVFLALDTAKRGRVQSSGL